MSKKKIFFLILLAIFGISFVQSVYDYYKKPKPDPKNYALQLSKEDNGKSITLNSGDIIKISLAGSGWQFEKVSNPNIVTQLEVPVLSSNDNEVSAEFQAINNGKTVILAKKDKENFKLTVNVGSEIEEEELTKKKDEESEKKEPKIPDTEETKSIVIGPDESVKVQCGGGNEGKDVVFKGKARGGFAGNVGFGQKVEIVSEVLDKNQNSSGGLVEWTLYRYGSLAIEGCKAVFTAPDSIGTAFSASAEIVARIPWEFDSANQTVVGEGGPRNAGGFAKTKVTILSGNQSSSCFNPAGVAVSINSVPTTSNVQIVVNTPRFLGKLYAGRNATVRDGEGTYEIQIFVNGGFYGATTSTVRECQLPTVRF